MACTRPQSASLAAPIPALARATYDKKFVAWFAAALLLLGVSGFLSYYNAARLIRNSQWVARTSAILELQGELLARLSQAEAGHFAYILSGDEARLEPYHEITNRIERLQTRLRAAYADEPIQLKRLELLRPLIRTRLLFLEKRIALRRQSGLPAAAQTVQAPNAKDAMARIRQTLDQLSDEETSRLKREQREEIQAAHITLGFDVGFGVVSLIALGVLFFFLLSENSMRRQREASLQEARDALELRVQERTRALAETNQALQNEILEHKRAEVALRQSEQKLSDLAKALAEKNQELEMLVYVASHDLRSPLVNVQGFSAELIHACHTVRAKLMPLAENASNQLSDVAGLLQHEIPEALEYVRAGVDKMERLLNGFLRFSRLGRQALHIRELDVNGIFVEIAATIEYQLKKAGAALQIGPIPKCFGDSVQMLQVFSNLLDNSLKYRRRDQPLLIRVSGGLHDGESVYLIEDNGVGIAPEHQKKIFEIFQRIDPGKTEGEGLGLTIAKKILERQNGRIWVESEPGNGSRFFVAMPSVASRAALSRGSGPLP